VRRMTEIKLVLETVEHFGEGKDPSVNKTTIEWSDTPMDEEMWCILLRQIMLGAGYPESLVKKVFNEDEK